MAQHTIVLVSGGIDSSTTIAVCQEGASAVSGVFVDYGQPAALSEWEAVQRVASFYRVPIKKIDLGFKLPSTDSGEFFGRNAILVLVAAGTTDERPLAIALGIHALTEYYDATPIFAKHMQRVLDGYSGGSVQLRVPLISDTKSDVIRIAIGRGVPLELTYSCERQNAPACAECPSCRDRIEANVF